MEPSLIHLRGRVQVPVAKGVGHGVQGYGVLVVVHIFIVVQTTDNQTPISHYVDGFGKEYKLLTSNFRRWKLPAGNIHPYQNGGSGSKST